VLRKERVRDDGKDLLKRTSWAKLRGNEFAQDPVKREGRSENQRTETANKKKKKKKTSIQNLTNGGVKD